MADESPKGPEPQGTAGGRETSDLALRTIDEGCRRAFEAARRAGTSPPLEEFLPACDSPCYLATVEELACIDMEFAWKAWVRRGAAEPQKANGLHDATTETVSLPPDPLERYLARFPVLRQSAILQRLVQHERLMRAQAGFQVSASEYRRRFPDLELADGPILDTTEIAAPGEMRTPSCAAPSEPTAANLETQGMIGRFRLERILGRGGFGTVYKAYDPLLERDVALKVPRVAPEQREEMLRFLGEAKAAAQLKHPHIVTVFETGQAGNQYYIVSEFLEGVSLAEHLVREHPDFRTAARWIVEVAGALHYAHGKGIIHRDVKPANIMLDAEGRTQLMDFGLAKRLDADETLTVDGVIMGTPAYMGPEQARGAVQEIGPHSDQYSLGVVLYQLLTGRLPFKGPGMAYLNQIIALDPPRPRSIRSEIPPDLEAICLRAMEKDPRHRYADAGEMAEDLQRWLDGLPTLVRPLRWHQRARRWARRHPAVAALSGAVAAALVVIVVGSIGFAWNLQVKNARIFQEQQSTETARKKESQARIEADQRAKSERAARIAATAALQRAETELARVKAARYAIQLSVAQQHIRQGDYLAAWERLDECAWDNRGWEHDYLVGQITERTKILKGHTGAVSSLAFSPDGRFLATCAPGAQPRTALWDVASGQRLYVHDSSDGFRPTWCGFSPDAKLLLLTSPDDRSPNVRLYAAENGKQVFSRTVLSRSTGELVGAPSRDGGRLAWAENDKIVVWDTGKDQMATTVPIGGKPPESLALSPDGAVLAAIFYDEKRSGILAAWRLEDGKELYRVTCQGARNLLYSPCGRYLSAIITQKPTLLDDLFSAVTVPKLTLLDAQTGRAIFELNDLLPITAQTDARFSPDGNWFAAFSPLRVCESATGRVVVSAPAVIQRSGQIAFIPSEQTLLVADVGNLTTTTLTEWNLVTGRTTRVSPSIQGVVAALDVSPDGRWLALATGAERPIHLSSLLETRAEARVWLLARSAKPEPPLCRGPIFFNVRGDADPTRSRVAFDPEGRRVAALELRVGDVEVLYVWELGAQQPLFTVRMPRPPAEPVVAPVAPIAYSLDGNLLAVARPQGQVFLLDAATGAQKATLDIPSKPSTVPRPHWERGAFEVLQFAPDGKSLWAATAGAVTVVQWDLASREPRAFYPALAAQDESASTVAISRDCRRLLAPSNQTARGGYTGRLFTSAGFAGLRGWHLATGREAFCHITLNKGMPILSDDGEYLAMVWGPAVSGEVSVYRWGGPPEPVNSFAKPRLLAFGPRNRLLSVVGSQTVRLADTATGQELLTLEGLPQDVFAAGFSGDGRSLIVLGTPLSWAPPGPYPAGNIPGSARVYRPRLSQMPFTYRQPFGQGKAFHCVAFHPDGKRVASSDSDGMIRIWSAETGEELAALDGGTSHQHFDPMPRMAFSPLAERLFVSGSGGIWVVDAQNRRTAHPVLPLSKIPGGMSTMSVSPDGRFVAGSRYFSVVVCDAVTGENLRILGHPDVDPNQIDATQIYPTHPARMTAVAFGPDGNRVLTASDRQFDWESRQWRLPQVALWDRATGNRVALWEPAAAGGERGGGGGPSQPPPQPVVRALAFSPRGDRIVACGDDGQVWFVDAQSLGVTKQWTAHDSTVYAIAVHRDGKRFATAGEDQTICIWDLATGERLAVLPGHSGTIYDLAFSPDGTRLASAAADGTVKIWNWAAFLPAEEPVSKNGSISDSPSPPR